MLLFCAAPTFAQDALKAIDSLTRVTQRPQADTTLINNYYLLAKEYQKYDVEKGEAVANKLLALAKKIKFEKGVAHYNILKAGNEIIKGNYEVENYIDNAVNIYTADKNSNFYLNSQVVSITALYYKADYEKGITLANDYLQICKTKKLNKIIGFFFLYKAMCENRLNKLKESLISLDSAVFFLKKSKNTYQIIKCYNIYADIYAKTDQFQKSIVFLKMAITLAKINNYNYLFILSLSNLSCRYIELENYDLAYKTVFEALRVGGIYKTKVNNSFNNSSLGIILFRQKKYHQAINKFKTILNFDKDLSVDSKLRSYQYLGNCYFILKSYKNALYFQNKIIKFLLDKKELFNELAYLNIYDEISNTYIALGNYEKAYFYTNLSKTKNIDFLNEEKKAAINELLVKFETNEKQDKLKVTQLELRKKKADAKTNKLYIIGLALALIMISMLVIFFIRINTIKESKNVALQIIQKNLAKAASEKEILLKEVHHRVKNNLQLINSLFFLQAHYKNLPPQQLSFVEAMQSRIDAMALVHQNLYEGTDLEHVSAAVYFTNLVRNIQKMLPNDFITVQCNFHAIELPMNTAVSLGLIINELLLNALKHGFPNQQEGIITISFETLETGTQKLTITDNGIGFAMSDNHKSLGLKLVQLLTAQLNGNLTITHNKGSQFYIQF